MSALITSGQRKQLKRLFEDGAEWAIEIIAKELTQDEAQRVLGRGNDLRAGFPELIRNLARSQHDNEEVKSNYDYPAEYRSAYKKRQSVRQQVEALLAHFPSLNAAWALEHGQTWYDSLTLPDWVEGPLVYVWWEAFGSYNAAVELILAKIETSRRFYNYRSGKLGPQHLQQVEQTATMEKALKVNQPGDILVVPSQAGFRHRGRSTRRAQEIFEPREFGLGTVAEGCRVLTYPERFVRWEQLHVNLVGDKYAPVADGGFRKAPYFLFGGDGVGFDAGYVDFASGRFGSASGLLSQ